MLNRTNSQPLIGFTVVLSDITAQRARMMIRADRTSPSSVRKYT